MRLGFILLGVGLLERFHWLTYLLGAFLVYTAIKLAATKEHQVDPGKNIIFRWLKPLMGTQSYDSGAFFMRSGGKWLITKLKTSNRVLNIFMGIVFILAGLFQLYNMLFKKNT
jgi:tellurite resistance protein TerC